MLHIKALIFISLECCLCNAPLSSYLKVVPVWLIRCLSMLRAVWILNLTAVKIIMHNRRLVIESDSRSFSILPVVSSLHLLSETGFSLASGCFRSPTNAFQNYMKISQE